MKRSRLSVEETQKRVDMWCNRIHILENLPKDIKRLNQDVIEEQLGYAEYQIQYFKNGECYVQKMQ